MLKARFTEEGLQQILDEPYYKNVLVHDYRNQLDIQKLINNLRTKFSHRMMQIDKGEVVCLQYVIIDNYKAKLILTLTY